MSCEEIVELTPEEKAQRFRNIDWWRDYIRARGDRYAECRLCNFEATSEIQRSQLALLKDYNKSMGENLNRGWGVTLFGATGTGKDHLAAALCRVAILRHGRRCIWLNGMDLFSDLRRSFDGNGRTENELINEWRRCPLLSISDPIPPFGELTSYQAAALFRILDGRYSAMLPTIITVNVAKGEAEARLTAPIVDRLRETSLLVNCNWPSHRKGRP